jgi:hypothetical protein
MRELFEVSRVSQRFPESKCRIAIIWSLPQTKIGDLFDVLQGGLMFIKALFYLHEHA